jgi:aminoglycoside/choline kinase family phosphotransferase
MDSSTAKTINKQDLRLDQAAAWLQQLGIDLQSDLEPVAGDASFRRYFRLQIGGQSRVLMDAPPPGEDVRPFIDIDQRLRTAGLHAPEIIHADTQNGYLLLEDFGDDLYRDVLNDNNSDVYFPGMFDVLIKMALNTDASNLPDFDAQSLRRDMDLFPGWYLGKHRKTVSHAHFDEFWGEFCQIVIASALEQPQCFIHRDFHSCNLLKTSAGGIGIIDFQDANNGPISYDLISLLWDRYIDWPRAQLESWIEEFRLSLGLDIDPQLWLRYCDLMGLQRNFKIVGIFARLYYRDGKNGYIEMIPRFYGYLLSTLRRYPEFKQVLSILEQAECAP